MVEERVVMAAPECSYTGTGTRRPGDTRPRPAHRRCSIPRTRDLRPDAERRILESAEGGPEGVCETLGWVGGEALGG